MEAAKAKRPWMGRGWMLQYLLAGDPIFTAGRWDWWLSVEGIPEGPIPYLGFVSPSFDTEPVDLKDKIPVKFGRLTPDGAYRHLRGLLDKMGDSWGSLRFLMEWLAYGLGVEDEMPTGEPDESHEMLYREFQLPRLQAARADVFGRLFSENIGGGWNPNAFFPTPANVIECMVQMTMHDGMDKIDSVCDPCCGTGRMLLHASNYSVNLWGMDIDRMCVLATKINAALFMPWLIAPKLDRGIQDPDETSKTRVAQGHPPLPKQFRTEKNGQLLLFEEV